MLAYYSAARLPRMKAVLFLCLVAVLCLAWIIPTGLAYHEALGRVPGLDQTPIGAQGGTSAYVGRIVSQRSILSGINGGSIANVIRYVLPLLVAFWPVLTVALLSLARGWKDWRIRMMLFWILTWVVLLHIQLYWGRALFDFPFSSDSAFSRERASNDARHRGMERRLFFELQPDPISEPSTERMELLCWKGYMLRDPSQMATDVVKGTKNGRSVARRPLSQSQAL